MQTVRLSGPAGSYEVPIHRASLSTRFLQGAALAAGLTFLRVIPILGKNFPIALVLLVAVSLGGGAGGMVYYATDVWRVRGGMHRTAANVVSLLVYCFVTAGLVVLLSSALGVE